MDERGGSGAQQDFQGHGQRAGKPLQRGARGKGADAHGPAHDAGALVHAVEGRTASAANQ